MSASEDRDKLIGQMGRMVAVRRQVDEARRTLRDKAHAQLDSIPAAQEHIERHVERDKGGGPLAGRALRTMLTERARLHHVTQTDDTDTDTDDADTDTDTE